MGRPLSHALRVRYGECDPQGVVFNSHYLAYLDTSITELWRTALGSYKAMMEQGIDIVVAEARLRFKAPARFDDELTLEVGIVRLGETSVSTAHRILRGDELLAEGALRHVFVDLRTLAKTNIPEWIRRPLSAYVVDSEPGLER